MDHFWNNKKVLITGATGLVGSSLTRKLLEEEANVIALVRDHNPQSDFFHKRLYRKAQLVQGELEDFLSIERAINEHEVEIVFHLGAQTIVGTAYRSPLSTFESNIRGTYNLLEACRRHIGLINRIVIASSDKAYGDSDDLPYDEGMALAGKNPYDVSKSCTDLLSSSYFHTYRLPLTIARCGNIYGGGDLNWSRLIPGTIRSFFQNQSPSIRSDGKFTRDYLFIDDVVNAYMLLAEQVHRPEVQGEAFNFGPTAPTSVLEIVQAIQQQMGKHEYPPKILEQASGEIRHQSLSSEKARRVLGWRLQNSLEEGLAQTIDWYERYLEREKTYVF